jgi:hypothetical protein
MPSASEMRIGFMGALLSAFIFGEGEWWRIRQLRQYLVARCSRGLRCDALDLTGCGAISYAMLRFDQDRVCKAIIRHLEARGGQSRADVCVRDDGTAVASTDARVEMTFRLGEQLYALEHTGIEPFDGFVEMNNEADRVFEPLRQSLTGALDPSSTFELTIQLHALRGRKMNDVKKRHDSLRQWVLDTAPTIPRRPYGDMRCGQADGTVEDIPVTLRRWDSMGFPGNFMIRHFVSKIEESRAMRIARACDKKLPKLDLWRRDAKARTVLVLEENDIQTTNVPVVCDAYLDTVKGRADVPDETWLVSTAHDPWYAHRCSSAGARITIMPTSSGAASAGRSTRTP